MMKPAKDCLDLGIVVSDIKASLNFYQNLLGLEFVGSPPYGLEPCTDCGSAAAISN
jgi:hypothetical protein